MTGGGIGFEVLAGLVVLALAFDFMNGFHDARFLDRQYTVWGQVTSGMENVDKIKRGEPVRDPDKIISAKMS